MSTPKKQRTELPAEKYTYLAGHNNQHSSEAIPNSLPKNQNTPQQCAFGLYAEQLNGTSFTTPRRDNQRSWLYKIKPSVDQTRHEEVTDPSYSGITLKWTHSTPAQLRWHPLPLPEEGSRVNFLQGLRCYAGAGDPALKVGLAVYLYACNASMENVAFLSADGDWLIVPESGVHDVWTEFGRLTVSPGEIVVIPRGIKFAVHLGDGKPLRGYIAEVFDGHFVIPDLGPIGSNGLADPRHFLVPTAAFEDKKYADGGFTVFNKFNHTLWKYGQSHSAFDVVAWHGNYVPYKYDLSKYCVVNTVSFDHLDPSIFTVITCQTARPGVAALDFVIFPPRWGVAEHTFRPPYYHRNCMAEFMGLIRGRYEAKKEGFLPGGATLHSCMSNHGPEAQVFETASKVELAPERVAEDSLAFMFESTYSLSLTDFSKTHHGDVGYMDCWKGLKQHFEPPK
eukprot:TRINITY_DN736_c0_g1_i1.p1 TRINITY_DN736_c0_g1~~TRINITY_DN736_c0_g1_i1.p1  ORF type:complete len:450 (-),score=63.65 TRINITY_DN736_c0_g1_i1:78-1427(-)